MREPRSGTASASGSALLPRRTAPPIREGLCTESFRGRPPRAAGGTTATALDQGAPARDRDPARGIREGGDDSGRGDRGDARCCRFWLATPPGPAERNGGPVPHPRFRRRGRGRLPSTIALRASAPGIGLTYDVVETEGVCEAAAALFPGRRSHPLPYGADRGSSASRHRSPVQLAPVRAGSAGGSCPRLCRLGARYVLLVKLAAGDVRTFRDRSEERRWIEHSLLVPERVGADRAHGRRRVRARLQGRGWRASTSRARCRPSVACRAWRISLFVRRSAGEAAQPGGATATDAPKEDGGGDGDVNTSPSLSGARVLLYGGTGQAKVMRPVLEDAGAPRRRRLRRHAFPRAAVRGCSAAARMGRPRPMARERAARSVLPGDRSEIRTGGSG
jgi:hypothetical protein